MRQMYSHGEFRIRVCITRVMIIIASWSGTWGRAILHTSPATAVAGLATTATRLATGLAAFTIRFTTSEHF